MLALTFLVVCLVIGVQCNAVAPTRTIQWLEQNDLDRKFSPPSSIIAKYVGRVRWRDNGANYDSRDCDGNGIMTCPVGTCYTGIGGFIGCCTVAYCAVRTTCIEYQTKSTVSCDHNTGGCLSCTDPNIPYCATLSNAWMTQYAIYCDTLRYDKTLSYNNPVTALPGAALTVATSTIGTFLSTHIASVTGGSSFGIASAGQLFSTAPSATSVIIGAPITTITTDDSPSGPRLPSASLAGVIFGSAAAGALVFVSLVYLYTRLKTVRQQSGRREGDIAPNAENDNWRRPVASDHTYSPLGWNNDLPVMEADSTPISPQIAWHNSNVHSISSELEACLPNRSDTPRARPDNTVSDRAPPMQVSEMAAAVGGSCISPLETAFDGSSSAVSSHTPCSPSEVSNFSQRHAMSPIGARPTFPTAEAAMAGGKLFGDEEKTSLGEEKDEGER